MFLRIRRQKGAVLYETLLSLPILLMLIFLGIKGMVLGYRALVLQYAAGQAVRKLAIGICDGPKLASDLSSILNVAETTTCSGSGTAQVQRGTYAYEYARVVAWRFGLKLERAASAPNRLRACVLELGDGDLVSSCNGGAHIIRGVPQPTGNTPRYGVLQLRTDSGLGGLRLSSSESISGPISGFDGRGTSELRALAIARIER